MTPGVKPLIAGNWKMNGTRASLRELVAMAEAYDGAMRKRLDMLVCVPATLLHAAASAALGSRLMIGAQDCHVAASGAHTGDIAAEMIADAGAVAVIVGHSERRTDHRETDGLVRAKAEAALRADLLPVICIGETGAERQAGQTLDVLGAQLDGSLPSAPAVVVAYEPVWAIGTGLTPTMADIAEAHHFVRERLVARHGPAGRAMRILYGGSVKPANAAEILAIDHVDGALVGGASLKSADLLAICACCPG
ncbi:MAG: triosephosphate isomerase [Alphaproteobacteria bacterium]|nr:MAG: triosephosphate isomerase [Alphaproteobacteria bacterium]